MLVALAVAFLLELSAMATTLALALPGVKFDALCTVTSTPMSLIIYGCVLSSLISRSCGMTLCCTSAASVLFQGFLFPLIAG